MRHQQIRNTICRKKKKAVDADNGLWLCANHDKLFEYGLIYFEDNKLIISDKLDDEQKKFITSITYNLKEETSTRKYDIKEGQDVEHGERAFYIKDEDYNENMHGYLELHRERTNGE